MTSPREPQRAADLVITRTFDAPRSLVWEAWTDPEQAKQWWSPETFTTPVFESDLRVGGRIHIVMRQPDGTTYPDTGVYEEIVPGERLVRYSSIELEPGKVGFEARTAVTFEDDGAGTKVTASQWFFNVAPEAEYAPAGAHEGWRTMLDKLAAYLRR
ncbi:MAG TPA: SRPBCC domain-containing protein [Candidatus Elarobacter sp.]|jgi:uncharacterized protein YndB with AHSA1/START domain